MATNDQHYAPNDEPVDLHANGTIPATNGTTKGEGSQNKLKIRKTRRGWGSRGKKANKAIKLTLFGNNANGLKAKKESLLSALKNFNYPSCVLIQETKLRNPGTFTIQGYQIFEKTRTGFGGGLLTAIENDLSPVLISLGSNESEILVVQISVGRHKIRIINGYGPQEQENYEKIGTFWQDLEQEIISAKDEQCMVLIQMDANAKLGRDILPQDPHPISNNGKLLRDIIKRQNLSCLNAHALCQGSITRHRATKVSDEKAILDFIIVCERLVPFAEKIVIDEKRENTLTKFVSLKGVRQKSESDHNPLFVEFNIKFRKAQSVERQELFNFKDLNAQKLFSQITNNSEKLRACIGGRVSNKNTANKFYKTLEDIFHTAFKKIRIRKSQPIMRTKLGEIGSMYSEKADLKTLLRNTQNIKEKEIIKNKLAMIEAEIIEYEASTNAKVVAEQVEHLDSLGGKFNQNGMWKIKRKLFPRGVDPPTAKKDEHGNIITEPGALKLLYLNTNKNRLKHRRICERYENIRQLKSELWELRFESLKNKPTKKWTIDDLEKATKSLKNNQSRDPNNMINELFKPKVAGNDLKDALVNLMNGILWSLYIPEFMQVSNITSIFKKKGSRMELSNDRGIFILSVLRKILDKLIYIDKYPELEKHMSDSNIGARKHKNVRNHLFIVYGVIQSVLKENRACVDIQIYDLVQAFDALWLDDCMNDIFDCLPEQERDKKVALIYQANVQNLVAVKTPVGQTDRVDIPRIVQQGGGWSPMECSISIDKLGRKSKRTGNYMYKYKNKVDILPLAMVDDLLGIAPCGLESLALNTFINVNIEMKKLKFHTVGSDGKSKCHKIHVGKKNQFCPKLLVHGTPMPEVPRDIYLGDVISGDGSNKPNIESRVSKGRGLITQILCMVGKISLGKHYFKIAFLLRETIFLSSVLVNSEVWYKLTKCDIEELEALDRSFMKRIFSVPNSTPTSALYLETGCLRIGTIIKARRLNYLHYLVKLPENDMLSRFFKCQWDHPNMNDWTIQVKKDLIDFKLSENLEKVKEKSSLSWKNLIRKRAKEFELDKLIIYKEAKNTSKLGSLIYDKLETQEYLKELTVNEAKAVFRFRTRMQIFDGNFNGKETKVLCPLCAQHFDLQELCFDCPILRGKLRIEERYESIFGSVIKPTLARVLLGIETIRREEHLSQIEAQKCTIPNSMGAASIV